MIVWCGLPGPDHHVSLPLLKSPGKLQTLCSLVKRGGPKHQRLPYGNVQGNESAHLELSAAGGWARRRGVLWQEVVTGIGGRPFKEMVLGYLGRIFFNLWEILNIYKSGIYNEPLGRSFNSVLSNSKKTSKFIRPLTPCTFLPSHSGTCPDILWRNQRSDSHPGCASESSKELLRLYLRPQKSESGF